MNDKKSVKCNSYDKIKTWEDLSTEQYKACILRADGLTLKEIAQVLKMEHGTVRNWSSQFMNKLLGGDEADYRVVSWKMITSQMISEVRNLMRRAIKNQDDAIFLKAVSEMNKLLQPYTPDDKQPEGTNLHIKILTAKEAELAEKQGDTVIKVDEYFSEKDEEQ